MFAERPNECNANTATARAAMIAVVRIASAGLRPRDGRLTLLVDGRPVTARPGDTVAAALIDAGVRRCRVTAGGEGRGLFCGMGVCQECVMTVDGSPARTCMTPVRDGCVVETFRGDGPAAAATEAPLERVVLTPELLVVGAGPAGLSAAAAASESGVRVVLVDERARPGGQFYKQPSEGSEVEEAELDGQYRRGRELIRRVHASGAELLSGVQVWAATGPRELLALGTGRAFALRPERLVLAPGAYERGVPLPGWTLPGFLTTGAAQTLMRAYQVLPGRRVLVAGSGPLNIQVAAEIVRAGGEVAAVCELARFRRAGRAPALAQMAAASPALAAQGARYLGRLARAGVPVLAGHAVVRAEGDATVEQATVSRIDASGRPLPGSERPYAVDAVCAGFGFLPSNELARTLGAKHVFDSGLGQLVAVVDDRGRSSLDGVWIVGDGAGTGGAHLAQATGFLAGVDAVRSLGRDLPPGVAAREPSARRALARSRRFQTALGRLFATPRLVDQLAGPDTLVCRCEGVTLQVVEASFEEGASALGAVKRVTRAGMGRCQGRYCAPVLAELFARRSGVPLTEEDWFAPAPPFKPIPVAAAVAAIAALSGDARARTG
jgi:NADPH-dependent 2,4-dienoyl-CoA reductase/sulfur reductase-like enzyme